MKPLKIIETSDGSHTLYNAVLDETYHSTHGALTESLHVFIKEGLHYYLAQKKPIVLNILEVGFGTGLNALLTCLEAEKLKIQVNYHSLEPYPIDVALLSHLNYTTSLAENSKQIFEQLHASEWERPVQITRDFTLNKSKTSLTAFKSLQVFDIAYFDAFAPRKQPELWEKDALEKVIMLLKAEGIFVTYSAMGALKRNLKSLDMLVESIPGPPGKREMTRGIKVAKENS